MTLEETYSKFMSLKDDFAAAVKELEGTGVTDLAENPRIVELRDNLYEFIMQHQEQLVAYQAKLIEEAKLKAKGNPILSKIISILFEHTAADIMIARETREGD